MKHIDLNSISRKLFLIALAFYSACDVYARTDSGKTTGVARTAENSIVELVYLSEEVLTRTPVTPENLLASPSWKIAVQDFRKDVYPLIGLLIQCEDYEAAPKSPLIVGDFRYGLIVKNTSGRSDFSLYVASNYDLVSYNGHQVSISHERAESLRGLFLKIDEALRKSKKDHVGLHPIPRTVIEGSVSSVGIQS